jgi:ketosteroid isomerase-like protein
MRISSFVVFMFAAICAAPLISACASSGYWKAAQSDADTCPSMEGYPDCRNGHSVDLVETASTPGADHVGIEDLQARYEQAIGSRDTGAYAALFTEDAVIESPSGVIKGREQIRGELARPDAILPFAREPHIVTNTVINIDGLSATGTASWIEVDKNGPGGEPRIRSMGRYEDQYIRHHGQWFIARRKIVVS